MRVQIAIAISALALGGCAGLASSIEALGKDPASNCINIVTMGGTVLAARVNRSGVKATVAGGSCTIEETTAAAPAP